MKKCPHCNAQIATTQLICLSCGEAISIIDGFQAYSPQLAQESPGFKENHFSRLYNLENDNFWFRARNQLILWALGFYAPETESFLEIGCGTGYVLSGISKKNPHINLYGSEIFTAGLKYAHTRVPNANFMQMDARHIPFHEEFDVIGAFDVLEHIVEDELVLEQINHALKPGGLTLLTVPQHPWLWSRVDENACHVRRYTMQDLHQKLTDSGFQILKSTSFVTSLLPAMMISRLSQRKHNPQKDKARAELKISPILNSLFFRLLNFEIHLIKMGFKFPIGGSRLVVAKKI